MSELQTKRIISVSSGKSIGNIIDAEILDNGRIESFIIDQNKSIFSLNRESDKRIYWDNISKIGEDVILVQKDWRRILF